MKVPVTTAVDGWANARRIPDAAQAGREFESFLVAEVWKQSQRGPRLSTLLGDGSAERMANEMWIDEVVGRAVAQRGLGLAERLETKPDPDAGDAP